MGIFFLPVFYTGKEVVFRYPIEIILFAMKKSIGIIFLFLPLLSVAQADASGVLTDSIHRLQEVEIREEVRNREIRSSAPLQVLNREKLDRLNALQLSDAVKFLSGVSVKDYGGIGGLKTVSVRSLGANHTAISYDGIRLTDNQTGQIDLGRFSLDNVNLVALSGGQSDNIFRPAQLFAAASTLDIQSKRPEFSAEKATLAKVSFKTGSFGLLNPSLYLAQRLGKSFSISLSSEYLNAHGKYPYILDYGFAGKDSSSLEMRQNTDVRNFRIESTLFGKLSETDNLEAAFYYYASERGLPGPTVFYNIDNFSSQRLWDKSIFFRGRYQKELSQRWAWQSHLKYQLSPLRYLDPSSLNEKGKEESNYLQQEYYASTALLFRAGRGFSFAAASDLTFAKLEADSYNFVYPERLTWLAVVAAKYNSEMLLATASLLNTVVREAVQSGSAGKDYHRLSPYASLALKPFSEIELRFRAFYKQIFRMPTFNDLYYMRIGNPKLLPEQTEQFNIGLSYSLNPGGFLSSLSFTADAYHNRVHDKIVAVPRKDIFVWTMLNFGKVDVKGLDLTIETLIRPARKLKLALSYTHSYQRVLNQSNPGGLDYGHQLPYTPRVSGSGRAALKTPWVELAYTLLWSGHRYIIGQNYTLNRLEGYSDQSLSLARSFSLAGGIINLSAELLNLADENYVVVKYFPMPGRSGRLSLSYRF